MSRAPCSSMLQEGAKSPWEQSEERKCARNRSASLGESWSKKILPSTSSFAKPNIFASLGQGFMMRNSLSQWTTSSHRAGSKDSAATTAWFTCTVLRAFCSLWDCLARRHKSCQCKPTAIMVTALATAKTEPKSNENVELFAKSSDPPRRSSATPTPVGGFVVGKGRASSFACRTMRCSILARRATLRGTTTTSARVVWPDGEKPRVRKGVTSDHALLLTFMYNGRRKTEYELSTMFWSDGCTLASCVAWAPRTMSLAIDTADSKCSHFM
mmetsp:Transcript_3720/g.11247  ORF Transcript_3720/g.11247 Transcript_3720/m.11247 type:complete len:270 (-) Transcript_3720:632-1441(-)